MNNRILKVVVLLTFLVAVIGVILMVQDNGQSENEPESFIELINSQPGVVIDVRTEQEYNAGYLTIADAQYDWRNGEFHEVIVDLDKEETYYLYCRTGNRSSQAADLMRENGFQNVYNIGGFKDLTVAGFDAAKAD